MLEKGILGLNADTLLLLIVTQEQIVHVCERLDKKCNQHFHVRTYIHISSLIHVNFVRNSGWLRWVRGNYSTRFDPFFSTDAASPFSGWCSFYSIFFNPRLPLIPAHFLSKSFFSVVEVVRVCAYTHMPHYYILYNTCNLNSKAN